MDNLKQDELMHYGRKGMKWGQHIFGDKSESSGSSTKKETAKSEPSAGRKAVDSMVEKRKIRKTQKAAKKSAEEAAKKAAEEAAKKSAEETAKKAAVKPKQKPISEMTDEELSVAIARLELEKKYKEAVAYHNPHQGKAKKFVDKVLERSGEQLVTQVVNYYGAKALNKAIGEEAIFANNKKK